MHMRCGRNGHAGELSGEEKGGYTFRLQMMPFVVSLRNHSSLEQHNNKVIRV